MLKEEEERFAYLGWGEELDEAEENGLDGNEESTATGRRSTAHGSNEKRISAIKDAERGIEILVVQREHSQMEPAKSQNQIGADVIYGSPDAKSEPPNVSKPFAESPEHDVQEHDVAQKSGGQGEQHQI